MIKTEIQKEIETQVWLIKQASQDLLDLLDKYGESLMTFEQNFTIKQEVIRTNLKFSQIAKTFEKNNLDILKMKDK